MEQWLTPSTIIALLALTLGVVNGYYARSRNKLTDWKKDFDDLEKKLDKACEDVNEVKGNVKVLDKQMNLFWKTVEQQMAKKFKDD